ncbi:MAG: threonine/serine exporter family protein [Peptostreptococcaceae bacterium]
MDKDKYKKDILRLALFTGELMLSNGAETYRVEDSIVRICKSRGFNHVNVFTSPTAIIISDERFDGYTFMKVIKSRKINLEKVSLINDFSRKFVSNQDISAEEGTEILIDINKKVSYNKNLIYLSTGLGSAFFAAMLGGDNILTFLSTIFTAFIGGIIFDKIMLLSSIPAFSSLITSSFIALIGVIFVQIGILDTPRMLIVGSIMPLLPGVAFIKGIRDLISGDLISGVSRAFDATMTAVSIACGVGLVLDIYLRFGGNF